MIFGPPGASHELADKYAKVKNVTCIGRSETSDPGYGTYEVDNKNYAVVNAG